MKMEGRKSDSEEKERKAQRPSAVECCVKHSGKMAEPLRLGDSPKLNLFWFFRVGQSVSRTTDAAGFSSSLLSGQDVGVDSVQEHNDIAAIDRRFW